MGTFRQRIEVAASPKGPFRGMYALVDTGSFYTWVPGRILRELGVEPMDSIEFELANGERVSRERYEVALRMAGQTIHTICAAGESKDQTLLGAYTLEGFALAVDPVNKKLVRLPVLPAAHT